MIKDCFVIDLDKTPLEIKTFESQDVKADMKYFRVRKPIDLSDYDRKVFTTLKAAEKYLARYKATLSYLRKGKTCLRKDVPAILYKRRYMVQSLMREKNQTYRDSPRVIQMMSKLRPGDMFNLYDQTYNLTVVLTSVSKSKGVYKYSFKLPRGISFKQ
jgi:hypothetical protein